MSPKDAESLLNFETECLVALLSLDSFILEFS